MRRDHRRAPRPAFRRNLPLKAGGWTSPTALPAAEHKALVSPVTGAFSCGMPIYLRAPCCCIRKHALATLCCSSIIALPCPLMGTANKCSAGPRLG